MCVEGAIPTGSTTTEDQTEGGTWANITKGNKMVEQGIGTYFYCTFYPEFKKVTTLSKPEIDKASEL